MKAVGLKSILNRQAEILILGSMPGRLSLKRQEYYAHPANQFWKIIAVLSGVSEPGSYAAKKTLLKRAHLSVWDVLASCERRGSADAAIRKECMNNFREVFKKNPKIRLILLNGRKAETAFRKTYGQSAPVPYAYVPSSSPANARLSLNRKIALWRKAMYHKP